MWSSNEDRSDGEAPPNEVYVDSSKSFFNQSGAFVRLDSALN
jgi:hypothetical protein